MTVLKEKANDKKSARVKIRLELSINFLIRTKLIL